MKLHKLLQTFALLVLATGCASPTSTAATSKPYPFKVCLVSGNKLDSMGDTISETYNGHDVKFCCEPCVKKFHAHPEKYLPKLGKQAP
jgi:YHS domain-containing protein